MDGFLHCLLLEVSLLLDEIRLKFLFDIFVSLDVPFIFIYHDFFTAFAPAWDMLSSVLFVSYKEPWEYL